MKSNSGPVKETFHGPAKVHNADSTGPTSGWPPSGVNASNTNTDVATDVVEYWCGNCIIADPKWNFLCSIQKRHNLCTDFSLYPISKTSSFFIFCLNIRWARWEWDWLIVYKQLRPIWRGAWSMVWGRKSMKYGVDCWWWYEFVNYKYGREINQEFSLERWECLNRLNE